MIYTKKQSWCCSIPSCLWAWHVAMFLKVNSSLSIQPSFCSLIHLPLIQQIQRKSCFNPTKDFTCDSRTKNVSSTNATEFFKIKFDKFCMFRLSQSVFFYLNTTKRSKFRSLQIKELSLILFQSCVNWMIFFVCHLAEMMLMTVLILNLAREH